MAPPMFTGMFKGLGKPSQSLELNMNSLERNNQQLKVPKTMQPEIGANEVPKPRSKNVLELLEASFRNIPTPQDQEVIDPKHAMSVWEEHNYPTVPLFNRKEHFQKMDVETLFFAFYYQQGTY